MNKSACCLAAPASEHGWLSPWQSMSQRVIWASSSTTSSMCALNHAGEVLYNWRVFPLHLNEPPVLSLQETSSRTSGQAALAQHLDKGLHTQQQEAEEPGRALLHRQAHPEVPGKQQELGAVDHSNGNQCKAWPEDGGLPDGPAAYR